jgi:GDPmannose 4,6-dehydratase
MVKKALITGVTGQDGSYLAELLLEKGYEVHGLIRRVSMNNLQRIKGLEIYLHYGDLSDSVSINEIVKKVKPDEIYNLAAQSHVKTSFDCPESTGDINALGVIRLLEAIRLNNLDCKFYQASTSELFGNNFTEEEFYNEQANEWQKRRHQNEQTPFYPCSPYALSKLYAYWACVNYRDAYGMFTCNGILFNHESPRRGEDFVTRKITKAVARIKKGLQDKLYLGNMESRRDWGHAKDYVKAMYLMMQQSEPDDFVIATGEAHSVKAFVKLAFDCVELNWYDYVEVDPKLYRPKEVHFLRGNPTKAKEKLGWEPDYTFSDLVSEMVNYDLGDI